MFSMPSIAPCRTATPTLSTNAADAWDRLGSIYQNTTAKDKITISIALFDDVVSDDVAQVREDLKAVETSIGELLNACLKIKKTCLDYKESIEELRKEIKGFLEAIVQEAVIDAAISVIATCVTGPVGAVIAGAKAVESARRWSVRIKAALTAWRARKLLQLRGLADDVKVAITKARRTVQDLCDRLRRGAGSVANAGRRLYSKRGARSSREILDSGDHLPLTRETIEEYARKAGIDLSGTRIDIGLSPDDIRYYDSEGASASTIDDHIVLAPSAFENEESLIRNLVHEKHHVQQWVDGRTGRMADLEALEKEAYDVDEAFWNDYSKRGK